MQKMKMPIITSVIVIALVAAGLGMGTMAYYSDTEMSTGNVVGAATFNLDVANAGDPWSEGVTATWVKENMCPGDEFSATLYAHNDGSQSVEQLWFSMQVTDDHEGATTEAETGNLANPGELDKYLYVTAFEIDIDGVVLVKFDDTTLYLGSPVWPNQKIRDFCNNPMGVAVSPDGVYDIIATIKYLKSGAFPEIEDPDWEWEYCHYISITLYFEFKETGAPQNDAIGDVIEFEVTLEART